MSPKFRRFVSMISAAVVLSLCLMGCGSSGSTDNGTTGFTVSGKINLVNGEPVSGATVTLFKTSYTIYPIFLSDRTLYGTRDSNGVESVQVETAGRSVTTDTNGAYSFSGVSSGNYTIQASYGTYMFKWSQVITLATIGVVTIADNGTVYVYNPEGSPEGSGNKLSPDNTVIYNTVEPFLITDRTLAGQDFIASLPGGR